LPSAPKAGLAEVDVVDAGTGRSVARDVSTMAEFVFRGACVMLGYLDDDGWFYTGDVGVVHPDGYLQVQGRDHQRRGEHHQRRAEVRAVHAPGGGGARPDEFCGETPCAFVVLKKEGAVTRGEDVVIALHGAQDGGLPRRSAHTGKAQKYCTCSGNSPAPKTAARSVC
jgi:acyl-CoA synthetase (AMP-forming)/AMP-acid ligase II